MTNEYFQENRQEFDVPIQMVGTDRSFNLIAQARQKDEHHQTFGADSLKLPLRSASFDSAISIAVIHHFSTDSLRIQAISEIHRIIKVGGKMLIYVWAYEQENKKFATQDVFVPWHLHDSYDEDKKKSKSTSSQASQASE